MKKRLVLALGFAVVMAGLAFHGEAKAPAVAFTLAAAGGDPACFSFTLAPRSTELTALAGPGGSGVIEDPNYGNTAVGWQALYQYGPGTGGSYNTAAGAYSLFSNSNGGYNTAVGYEALKTSVNGNGNTAAGAWALALTTTGFLNTAVGCGALQDNTEGYNNTASGSRALMQNLVGYYNAAFGFDALERNQGLKNTGLGAFAGQECVNGNFNIYVGADVSGQATDSNTIRIGLPYNSNADPVSGQNRTFVAGIVENPMTAGSVVGISAEGLLGTLSSDVLSSGPQGSLLFLLPGLAVPTGYSLLGTMDLNITTQGAKRPGKVTVNIYKKD